MKKISLVICAGIVIAATSFYSCKKNQTTSVDNKQSISASHKMTDAVVGLVVSVDERGFLVFPNQETAAAFASYLESNTLQSIKEYYDGIGFVCLNGGVFQGDLSVTPTVEQISDLMRSVNGLMKVNGTIFKLSPDNEYLYTINENSFNDESFELLNTNSFNAYTMNRFALDADREDGFNLLETIEATPHGISEVSMGITINLGGGRHARFWGKSVTYGDCDAINHRTVTTRHWIFWMQNGEAIYTYDPC